MFYQTRQRPNTRRKTGQLLSTARYRVPRPQLLLIIAILTFCGAFSFARSGLQAAEPEVEASSLGEHGFAKSGDTRIHYVTAGKGPLLELPGWGP